MAVFDTARTGIGAPASNGVVAGAVTKIIATLAAWNDARVTRNALGALTDRELEDIGLTRGDIDGVATRR